ncbi:hypothetical protein [Bacillus sp. B1-b2]|uniref:hypothetical protein n=1 Tax=Bacillus sp. B1-b2 TaxID=2653201 RepID=UPI001D0128B6|nr:hypothetical protein [Bacillus sp. B1-b2]
MKYTKIYLVKGVDMMEEQTNFFNGLKWGIVLSVPLWISLLGWIKILVHIR